MADLSHRLREPFTLMLVVIAAFGWLAFLAMWINASSESGAQQETIAGLTAERDSVVVQLSEQESAAGSLAEVQTLLSSREQELADLSAQLDTARGDLADVTGELSGAQDELEGRRTEATQLEETVNTASQQVAELETRDSELRARIDEANNQLTQIGSRLEEARALEATATANVAQFTAEAATATASLSETQTQLQRAREQLSAAQTQMAELATQTETSGQELAAIQQELSEMQGQRDTLATELDSYQRQRDELQPQVEQLTQTLADRSEELAGVEADLADALGRSDANDSVGRFAVTGEGGAQGLSLLLNGDGSFTLQSRTGRSVSGEYTLDDEQLQLTNATGDLGNASFPMQCPISRDVAGFTIGAAEGCVIEGLSFERLP